MNDLTVFCDERFGSVRSVLIDGEPWFVAADVCRALEISNPTMALGRLDDDEKMTLNLTEGHSGQRGGAQQVNVVNEPGLYSLILGSRMSMIQWTVWKVLAFAEALLMSMLLILGLFLIEAVFCIYSVKSVELVNALTYGGRSACQYPVDIYPRPLRAMFTMLAPFAMTLHVPAAWILGKPLYGWPTWTVFVCPLSGLVVFGAVYVLFGHALRHYRSTGS